MRNKKTLILTMVFLLVIILEPLALSNTSNNNAKVEKISCTVHIAAVSSSGEGVLGNLTVTIEYPGSGKVYISTSPTAEVDTQGSARTAAYVASMYAGVPMWNYNFYYDIESSSIIVGGPSAGAEMTLATLLLLTGHQCNSTIVATGMIQPDGSIGPVGGLKEKLEAVARHGGKIFVVPAGQTTYTYYIEKINRIGPFVYVTREPVTINLYDYGNQHGVTVYPAATILDLYHIALYGKPPVYTGLRPNWTIPEDLQQYIAEQFEQYLDAYNSTLQNITEKDKFAAMLSDADSLMNQAITYHEQGKDYTALTYIGRALVLVYSAETIEDGVKNGLNISSEVKFVNQSIIEVYNGIKELESQGVSSIGELYKIMKAYSLLGQAAYYYSSAIRQLELRGNSYYIPYSLFTGLNIEPVLLLERARVYSQFAQLWLEIPVDENTSINASILSKVTNIVESNAKTTLAYVSYLLDEVGAHNPNLTLVSYMLNQALSSKDPLEKLSLSIYSIVILNVVIQQVFPMKTDTIVEELLNMLSSRTTPTTPLESLDLQLAMDLNGTESLQYTSELVLLETLMYSLKTNTTSGEPLIITSPSTQSSQTTTNTSTVRGGKIQDIRYITLIIVIIILAGVSFIILYSERTSSLEEI